ncbi:MAG: peptide chain release factor N(5)-glutamine methyltransferase [Simkaniaceae bacterium]|nr:peptide chain release factor N(5)-glutamine methyltransferase [Simkaniaceae bacterium]
MNSQRPLSPSFINKNSLPEAYCIGNVPFGDLEIDVTPAVLIPRSETEILFEEAVKRIDVKPGQKALDLCCGSGAIGLALKKRLPVLDVTLADLSNDALNIAKRNAEKYDLEVNYSHGDFLQAVDKEVFDYIFCNPPYISESVYETLDSSVKDHEPKMALVGGKTGLEFYKKLSESIDKVLAPGGKLFLEIGYDQGDAVRDLFSGSCVEKDWSGHDRFVFYEKPSYDMVETCLAH